MANDSPPLFSLEGVGPPGEAETRYLKGAGGVRLRAALFPASNARGTALLNTGRTEFIEKYYEVIGELLGRGLTVLVHDWRGQGLSGRLLSDDPLKGHAQGARPFLDDLDLVLSTYEARLPRPWIVVGHSMGGALSLLHLLTRGPRFEGAVLSSPMTGVNLHGNPPLLVKASIFGRRLFGDLDDYVQPKSLPWQDVFENNSVTHDRARFTRTLRLVQAHHELALGSPTWGWLDFALGAAAAIQRDPAAARLTLPLRVVAAGEESLADTPATQAFCSRAPGADCIVAEGARHEILMEQDPIRAIFWREFDVVTRRLGIA